MKFLGNFKCSILSSNRLIYQNEIQSIFLTGDRGEYEILAYHYPLLGVLRKSNIIIDWKERVPIQGGIIRFFANECTVIVEEPKKVIELSKK
jgi:F0F1-type ATP synthase epsilon subunit